MLSSVPQRIVDDLLSIIKLEPYAPQTVTSVEQLKQQIDFVKTNGYSLEKEELEPGLSCIAVPLHIESANFFGGLSFSGSPDRFTEEKVRELSGATNPEEADPVSIRGAYGRVTTQGVYENVLHTSTNEAEAEREIKLWFKPDEIIFDVYETETIIRTKVKEKVWKQK